ncbi:MAG: YfhO family protein [Candidatus Margulisiibacteriota bacterium]
MRKPANKLRGFLTGWKPRSLVAGLQPDLLVIFLFFLVTVIFFARFLDGRIIFAFKDLTRYFYPLRHLMVEQVKSGLWPLWNPYIFCGFPLLATLQICFFYPLTLIYYLLPFNLGFNYYIIAHYFLAAIFMYALLRHYRLERPAAFFGGLVFAFSGYLLSVSNMNTSLSSVIWLPLVLLVFDRLVSRDLSPHLSFAKVKTPLPEGEGSKLNLVRVRGIVTLSIALALMFLGGEPTVYYTTFWLLLAYIFVFAKEKVKSIVWLGLSFALSLGLIAVQLLPFLELSRLSDRIVLTGFDLVSFRSFPPRELITFLFPFFFGNPADFGAYAEMLLGSAYQDWLISPFLGLIPLTMIFFAFKGKPRRSYFFLAAAGAGLLLAFGRYTPFYWLAFKFIPGVSLIRYPVKFLFLVSFCLAILSAEGFQSLLHSLTDDLLRFKRALRYIFPLFIVVFVVAWLGTLYWRTIFDVLARSYPPTLPKVFFDALQSMVQFNLQSLLLASGYLFILLALFWLVWQKKIGRNYFIITIILVTLADLLTNGAIIAVGASRDVITSQPAGYALLKKDPGLFRFYCTPNTERANRVIRGDTFTSALLDTKENFTANWPLLEHLSDFYGYESIRPLSLVKVLGEKLTQEKLKDNLGFLSLANVKYIVSVDKLSFSRLKQVYHKRQYAQDVYLYENLDVWPRAYLLDNKMRPNRRLGEVVIVKYRPGEIVMSVEAKVGGYLFLGESYYPGWQAAVDGRAKPILKAQELFCAVPIERGKHSVRFNYDPWSFKLGAVISIFCVLLSAICLLGKWGG